MIICMRCVEAILGLGMYDVRQRGSCGETYRPEVEAVITNESNG